MTGCIGTRPSLLKGRIGVGKKLHEVGLEPRAGLGSGLEGIILSTVEVIASRTGVRGTVTLATGLHPDEGVNKRGSRVGRWAQPEAGADGIAPITPRLLASGLLARAALVNNELGVPPLGAKKRGKCLNVMLLVVVGVA